MVPWRKLRTDGFGVGRNLRFGDLDGDGRLEILVGQVVHHGPKDRHSELGCLTALTLDGRVLWQSGDPDAWKDGLTNDVAFQAHDLDGDGRAEVVYCRDQELVVAEGTSGQVLRKIPTPLVPAGDDRPKSPFPRVLGDSLFFATCAGPGGPATSSSRTATGTCGPSPTRSSLCGTSPCATGHSRTRTTWTATAGYE